MNDVFNNIYLSYILEKKECLIDGELKTFYQMIDQAFSCIKQFQSGKKFCILTGSLAGLTISKTNHIYKVTFNKSLNQLCSENNDEYDYQKFLNQNREKYIGKYYIYNIDEDNYSEINDPKLLKKIKTINN